MHPTVEIRTPGRAIFHLSLRGPVSIGRDCDGVIVEDAAMSRRHAMLDPQGASVAIDDLGSTNGTLVGDRRVTGPTSLFPGQHARCGDTILTVLDETAAVRPAGGGVVRPVVAGTIAARGTSIDQVVASLGAQPAPTDTDKDLGTITIVFSDIEGSTDRAVAAGDAAWKAVLARHHELVRSRLRLDGGTEVSNQGDGFMMTFPGAYMAVLCMARVQRDLAEWQASDPTTAVKVRIGMHTGEAILEDGDLFGRHIHLAARVGNSADGGELVLSNLTREIVAARGDVPFEEPRSMEMKGFGTQLIHPIDWRALLSQI